MENPVSLVRTLHILSSVVNRTKSKYLNNLNKNYQVSIEVDQLKN